MSIVRLMIFQFEAWDGDPALLHTLLTAGEAAFDEPLASIFVMLVAAVVVDLLGREDFLKMRKDPM